MFITDHYPTSNITLAHLNFDTTMKKAKKLFPSLEKLISDLWGLSIYWNMNL